MGTKKTQAKDAGDARGGADGGQGSAGKRGDGSKAGKGTGQTFERARDRARTENRIVTAVGRVLARDGFQSLGINAVAREAGVDKVLIYRYFGGIAGLMEAYANEVSFWPTADELAGYDEARTLSLPLRQRIVEMMHTLARSLHRRPATQQIIAWELVERNELTSSLEQVRWTVLRDYVDRYVTEDDLKRNKRLVSSLNFIASAVMLLVARGQNTPIFQIASLDSDEAWAELDATIEQIVTGLAEA